MKKLALLSIGLILFSIIAIPKVGAQESKVVVEVNPNLELFAVVYTLAFNGSDDFIVAPQSYINDVLTYFSDYKDHSAIQLAKEIFPKDASYHIRDMTIARWAGDLAGMPYLGNESEDDPLLTGLYKELVRFAKDTNFIEFYNAHKEEYEKAIVSLKEALPKNFPQKFVEFFGYTHEEYKIELSYSLAIHFNSKYGVNSVTCVGTVPKNKLASKFRALIALHEFTHPFIDPLLDANPTVFENVSYYLEEVKREFPALSSIDPYHFSSHTYYRELLTEAFAKYLAEQFVTNLSELINYHEIFDSSIGFYLLDDFIQEFENFEKIKKTNETFVDYLPILARHMQKWSTPQNVSLYFKQRVPVTGFWALEKSYARDKIIIVYGTQNPDKKGLEHDRESTIQLKEHLKETFEQFYGSYPEIIIKSDANLTEDDLRENLILIGGPVANKITKELNEKLPIKFIFNGSWSLERNPNVVKNFNAFLFVDDSDVRELSLNSGFPKDETLGVVETIRNPWNEESFIIVVAGATRYGTRRVVKRVGGSPSYIIKGKTYHEQGFYMQW